MTARLPASIGIATMYGGPVGSTCWTAVNLGLPRSGIEATEAEAQQAAQRELERILSEARAAAQPRRELPVRQDRGKEQEPQS